MQIHVQDFYKKTIKSNNQLRNDVDNKQPTVILEHHHTMKEELLCHFPYAIFSVVFSMIFSAAMTLANPNAKALHGLFHLFHYLHLVFSATGVVLMYRRFSSSIWGALVAGTLIPAVFCTLSDMIFPMAGGHIIGLDVSWHWCFLQHSGTVLPFLIVGMINGLVMSMHSSSVQVFSSTGSHFLHILVSSMASLLYLVGYGLHDWQHHLATIFLLLIGAVLIPCTLSDIVVPMYFARRAKHPRQSKDIKGSCCSQKLS